ncbi:MarR family winged helix-turn-helix transcriptional regulator [Methanofollis ethanolicus]|uniref:MarR family winged helix-turn-helix transcriptional regulator n=1 Tax=Methanofollis ethanolicus TaxID=488124 RepID=UPI0008379085|nr:MarR family transcriptional regulator [Methanofollis ethanolicus]
MRLPQDTVPIGALISLIHRTHHIFVDEQMKRFGLSSGQLFTLLHLAHEQGITQDTLVRRFRVDKGTVARAVRKLEDAGYISRTVDPDDRRAVRIFLTERGEEIVPEIIRINQEWEEEVCTGLSAEGRREIEVILLKIAQNSLKLAETGRYTDYARYWKEKL